MVIVEREVERGGQRRRLENERKGGISTSNMTTTQGAGLGVRGEEGRRGGGEERRKGRAVVVMFILVFTFLIHFYSSIGKGKRR